MDVGGCYECLCDDFYDGYCDCDEWVFFCVQELVECLEDGDFDDCEVEEELLDVMGEEDGDEDDVDDVVEDCQGEQEYLYLGWEFVVEYCQYVEGEGDVGGGWDWLV